MKVKIHPILTLALRYHPLGLIEGYFRKGVDNRPQNCGKWVNRQTLCGNR